MLSTGETGDIREYRFQGYRLDVSKHSLFGPDGALQPLSSRAIDTLQLLIENRGQPLSKVFLLETVWADTCVEENNLNQVISSIRKALGDSKSKGKFIKTLTGKGYCFVAELDAPKAFVSTHTLAEPAYDTSGNTRSPRDHAVMANTGFRSGLSSTSVRGMVAVMLVAGVLTTFFLFLSDTPGAGTIASAAGADASSLAFTGPATSDVIPGSIAVLPFTNLTPDADIDSELFALGLHDELVNQLSQSTSLKIVSSHGVLTPDFPQLSLQEIGRLLHVESLITGSMLFKDGLGRIKLQILDPNTGVIRWAFDHDIDTGNLKDLLNAHTDLATRVSKALQADIGLVISPTIFSSPTDSFEAYRYNMAARRAYENQDFVKSLALSRKALGLDPDYLGALYNFSRAHYYLSSRPLEGMTTRDHLKLGLESAQRMIDLAPEKHEGYVLKATALGTSRRWDEAMVEIDRLKAMNAPLWDLQPIVPVLMSLGEYQWTIDILEANLQVEPLNGHSRGFLMAAYESIGNSMQAELEYAMGEELTPNWWGDVVNFFMTLGRSDPLANLENLQGTSEEIKSLLWELNDGDRSGVLSRLDAALYGEAGTSSVFVHYAAIAAIMGEHGLAIRFMQRATDKVPVHLHWIWLPVFRDTWRHPDFSSLLKSAGVLSYWQESDPPDICQSKPAADYFVCND
jgi:DNA-binding winged helix-turn-helix (wHTH) protein/TolB-like protein